MSEWIKTTQRLPKEGDQVWFIISKIVVLRGTYLYGLFYEGDHTPHEIKHVSHWMLNEEPELPEELL